MEYFRPTKNTILLFPQISIFDKKFCF